MTLAKRLGLLDTPTRAQVGVWLLVGVVTLYALAFVRLNPDRIVPGTDSTQYDLMARQLAAGRGFTLEAQPPFVPTQFREPGYPLFVATVYQLSGTNVEVVAVLQAIMLGLAAGLTAVLGMRLFGFWPGLIAGALFGLNSESAHYAHWLLTEVPFTLLLMAALLLAVQAQTHQRRRDFLLCGIGLGLATLVRVIAASLVLPLGLVLLITSRKPVRRRMTDLAWLLVGFAVVLAPWVGRNVETLGRLSISSRFGMNLVRRAPRAAEPLSAYPNWIVASVWMAANPLSNLVYPISRFQWGPNYEDNLIWDFHVNDQVRYNVRYEPVCQPQPDPDACYTDIGLAFVRAYPVGYAVQSVFALVMLLFAPLPGPQALEHNGLVWLGLLAVGGLALRRRLGPSHALVLAALAAYLGASIVVDTQVRYLLPVLPIFAIFSAPPLVSLFLATRRRSQAAAGRASGSTA
jgi:4-amino-4-deoxy-L-arabinose transferase-like glycosyltransferase